MIYTKRTEDVITKDANRLNREIKPTQVDDYNEL